jgi:hypothetical protein
MSEQKTDWIYIQTPENKQMIARPEYIKKLLGLNDLEQKVKWQEQRTSTLFEKFQKLEDEIVEDKYIPEASATIINYLYANPHSTRTKIMKQFPDWLKHSLCYHAFYISWERLEKSQMILPESHGKGHERTWVLKEAEQK